jgi:hypothetical protein
MECLFTELDIEDDAECIIKVDPCQERSGKSLEVESMTAVPSGISSDSCTSQYHDPESS